MQGGRSREDCYRLTANPCSTSTVHCSAWRGGRGAEKEAVEYFGLGQEGRWRSRLSNFRLYFLTSPIHWQEIKNFSLSLVCQFYISNWQGISLSLSQPMSFFTYFFPLSSLPLGEGSEQLSGHLSSGLAQLNMILLSKQVNQ